MRNRLIYSVSKVQNWRWKKKVKIIIFGWKKKITWVHDWKRCRFSRLLQRWKQKAHLRIPEVERDRERKLETFAAACAEPRRYDLYLYHSIDCSPSNCFDLWVSGACSISTLSWLVGFNLKNQRMYLFWVLAYWMFESEKSLDLAQKKNKRSSFRDLIQSQTLWMFF